MDTDRLQRFVTLDERIKVLDAQLTTLKATRKAMQEQILDDFADSSVERVTIDGRTVYCQRQIWAHPLFSREAVATALKEAGYGELVTDTFNLNSLSAVLRDRERAGDSPVPPELEGIIGIREDYSVRSVKA
jgi:hypothetical protein